MERAILVIDDEEVIRFALARYFGSGGCAVYTAATVGEAEELLSARSYQAAIVDLCLAEGESGFDLVDAIRAAHPETKLLMLTAYGSPETEAVAREHGVDAFLNKPKPLAQIAGVLEELLEHPLCAKRASRSSPGESVGDEAKVSGACR